MNENIIAVNVPNGVSIMIMMAIGGVVLAFCRKTVAAKASTGAKSGPVFNS